LCGAERLAEERIGAMVGDGAATLIARAFAASGTEPPADALERFVAIYSRNLLAHTRPYPGIPEALEHLKARAALAVLTNKPIAPTRSILEGLDLFKYFPEESVVGGDGPFPRKPDPRGLQHIHTRARISAVETVLVGDSRIDWRTARGAGTAICLARYGFGFEGFRAEDLAPGDLTIDTPAELTTLS